MDISKRTIKQLRSAASAFFPDDEAYHVWLGAQYGVDSTLDLTNGQGHEATKTINSLKRSAGRRQVSASESAGRITSAQKGYIAGLFKQIGIPPGKRQWGFIARQIGARKAVDWLSNREASKVITGLKRMVESNKKVKS